MFGLVIVIGTCFLSWDEFLRFVFRFFLGVTVSRLLMLLGSLLPIL
jgi:hypothetical protein